MRRTVAALLFSLVLTGCGINTVPEATPAPVPVPSATPAATTYQFAAVRSGYQILRERHVDQPASGALLGAALDGIFTAGKKSKTVLSADKPVFSDDEERAWATFTLAANSVAATYQLEEADAQRGALEGMAKSLNDCHTYYLDPVAAKTFNQPTPAYSGIGATISNNRPSDPASIAYIFPGSPAEKAGLRAGDQINEVDGVDVTGSTSDEVAGRIRGTEGTQVTLLITRTSEKKSVTLTRATIKPPTAFEKQYEDVGYIYVPAFNGDVVNQVEQSIRILDQAGVKSWVLDLRNNPGGDLTAAVDIASIFVKNATLVYQTGRDGTKQPVLTNDRHYFIRAKPLVVLVNSYSGSGSEILAAGVQANGAGKIVGQRTAGCVGVAQPRTLPNGGVLLITLSRMQDAKTGVELNGEGRGVAPDQTVVLNPEIAADTQLDAALLLLRGR